MELLKDKKIKTMNCLLFLFIALSSMTCKAKEPSLQDYSDYYNGIFKGEYNTVKVLLKKYPSLISWEFNFGGYQGDSLITATVAGDSKMVELLIKAGAEINYYDNNGTTPLITAIYYSRLDIVKLLIEAGADVEHKTNDGTTGLHIVAEKYNREIADLLLSLTTNIDDTNDGGFTPLAVSLSNFCNDFSMLLIGKGANLQKALASMPHIIPEYVIGDNRVMLEYFWKHDLINPYEVYQGNNLFHYACWHNNINFVKELLARGMWDSTPNSDGDTPLDFAREFGNQDIIDLVVSAGLGSK